MYLLCYKNMGSFDKKIKFRVSFCALLKRCMF